MSAETASRASWQRSALLIVIVVFCVVLTLHAELSRFNLDEYGDMTENYAWGALWQWGYFKHPPFFGWLVAAWFAVFPHVDILYYVFASLNVGVALLCMWRIARRYGDADFQLFVILAAILIPPFSFQAIKYNASSAMTPIWAATFLFYLRGLEKRRLFDAAMLGLLAAAGMLTKYYTAVLLLGLLAHALLDRQARSVLFSGFGLVTVLVAVVAFAGHLRWLIANDFMPITYAAEQGDGLAIDFFLSLIVFLAGIVVYLLPALVLALVLRSRGDGYPPVWTPAIISLRNSVEGRALLAFAVLPTVFTIALGFAAGAELSVVWALPVFVPLVILVGLLLPPDLLARNMRRALTIIAIYGAVLLVSAPIYKEAVRGSTRQSLTVPVMVMAQTLDRSWQELAGGADGPVIAGEPLLANGMSFYSRYHALALEANSYEIAKGYLAADEIERRGMIVICRQGDAKCVDLTDTLLAGRSDAVPLFFTLTGFDGKRQWPFTGRLLRPRG